MVNYFELLYDYFYVIYYMNVYQNRIYLEDNSSILS